MPYHKPFSCAQLGESDHRSSWMATLSLGKDAGLQLIRERKGWALSSRLIMKPWDEPCSFSRSMQIACFHHVSQDQAHFDRTSLSDLKRKKGRLTFTLLALKELSKPQSEGEQALHCHSLCSYITAVLVWDYFNTYFSSTASKFPATGGWQPLCNSSLLISTPRTRLDLRVWS